MLSRARLVEAEITLEDSIVQFGKIRSNYKLFEMAGEVGELYSIELRSLCDCLGFNKNVLYPVAYVINDAGEIINDKPAKFGEGRQGFTRPMNIHGVWSGKFPKSGKFYLFVAADNRNLGTTVADVNGQIATAPYAIFSVPMTSDVQGEIEVEWK